MPSRRPHTNSHHGCMQCKAKRVKCDQLQPRCSRCAKGGSDCTYRHLMTSYNPFATAAAAASSPSQQSSSSAQNASRRTADDPKTSASTPTLSRAATPMTITTQTPMSMGPPIPPLAIPPCMEQLPPLSDPDDIHLLNHYMANLSTGEKAPVLHNALLPNIKPIILTHLNTTIYVRHVVLCFSALHLASVTAPTSPAAETSGPDRSRHSFYLSAAFAHKDAALSLFLPAIRAGIDPLYTEPLLAASTVLVACELALAAADPFCRTEYDRIDILSHVAGLLQGTMHIHGHRAVDSSSPRWVRSSSAPGPSPSSSVSGSPADAAEHGDEFPWLDEFPWVEAYESIGLTIAALEAIPASSDPRHETRRCVLLQAATSLADGFAAAANDSAGCQSGCAWVGMFKGEFVDLIRERDPLALVIMGHWAASCNGAQAVWWAVGWPAAAAAAIYDVLEDAHKPLMEWCVRLYMPQSVGRPGAPSPGA